MTTKISTANLDATITTLIGSGGGPKATAITYPGNDLAADPAGGQTITLTGTGFVAGCSIFIGTTQASVVTVVSATSVTFTAPALAAATYTLYLVNPDGGTATIVPGISYSGTPTWSTSAGTLGSVYEYAAISNTVAATGDGSIVYSVFSGTLPTGSSLNTSTGVITGTSPASAGATTYTFVIRATDAQLQDTDRSFSITVNTDVVTWTTPADNSTTTLGKDVASSTTLLATSAAGNAITYTANTLPTGLSISGATVTGTPTVTASTTSTFTATAATTGKTATATINWTVSVASDTYFPYTTLLLSGSAGTETFIADASTNNFALTIVGDTKPNNFNPYTPGYYSNYFDGSGDYVSVPDNVAFTMGAGDFTIECWVNLSTISGSQIVIGTCDSAGSQGSMSFVLNVNSGTPRIGVGNAGTMYFATAASAISTNTWVHLAGVRNGASVYIYVNGVQSTALNMASLAITDSTQIVAIGRNGAGNFEYVTGYISNVRIVKGTAVYTANFTPPTAPLTAIANTSLLTCQSNRFIDNSSNAFTITAYDNTKVSSATPFVPNTAYAAYGSTYFDGTGDYLTMTSNASLGFGTDLYTVECWVYATAAPAFAVLFAVGAGGLQLALESSAGYIAIAQEGIGWLTSSTTLLPLNVWNHVAVSRAAAGLTKIFLNGTQIASGTNTTNFLTGTYANINLNAGNSAKITGYISNVRAVKGVAVYTANFTVPTAPLTATQSANTNGNLSAAITGTATSLLTCQTNQPASNSMFLDSSTNAFLVTRAGNVSAGTFSPYGANWSNYFSSANYISAASNAAFGFGTGDFTVEAWVYPNAAYTTYNYIWATSVTNGLVFYVLGGVLYVRTFNGSDLLASSTAPAINTWTHVAATRSGTTLRIFVNGVQTSTTTNSTNFATGSGIVGNDGANAAPWLGYISNLRVVKGTAVYTANFTPSTTPLTAIANTSLLTCQSNSLVDNSANAFTITKTGDTPVQRFSPFGPHTQTAITHSAYFDGTGDYLTVPSNAAFAMGTGDFTIECWVNTSVVDPQNDVIIELRSSGATSTGFVFNMNPTGVGYQLNFYTDGAFNLGSTVLNYNVWNHCAVTRSGTTVRLFSNGAVSATFTKANNFSDTPVPHIGVSPLYSPSDTIGYISNLRVVKGTAVYTAAFTPPTTPLTAIANTSLLTCQSPTFVDNSTNAFALTAVGDAKPRTQNPFDFTSATAAYSAATYGGSAYFDTSGDSISPPQSSIFNMSLGNWTAEAWFYSLSTNSGNARYIAFVPSAGSILGIIVPSGNFVLNSFGGGNAIATSIAATLNAWQHVALVKNGATTTLYINGVAGGSGTPAWVNASTTVYFGTNVGSYADNYNGYISSARVVMGTAVYKSNFVPPAAPLTAITNTSLLLNMNSAGIYDSASVNNLETVNDAKRVSTHTPYAGSYYSNYFTANTAYITVASNAAFAFPGEFTVEGWFNWSTLPSAGQAIGVLAAGGFNFTYGSGSVSFNNYGSGSIATATYTFVVGVWYHIAMTRNVSNTCTIWINGVSSATGTSAASFAQGTWSIYGGSNNGGAGYASNARIVKGVAVYTSTFTPPALPLTATQSANTNGNPSAAISGTATSLLTCQSNRFLDNSTNAFTITKNGETSVQSFNPFQRNSATTMYFDGTGDWLFGPAIPSNILTGNFTIELWVYPVVLSGQMGMFNLSGTSSSGSNSLAIYFDNGNTISFWVNGSGGLVTTSNTYTTGAWYHIALVRNGSTNTLYVNGISSAANSVTPTTALQPIGIGRLYNDNASYSLNGYINDLRITKGYARYTSTFTPPTTAFIAR